MCLNAVGCEMKRGKNTKVNMKAKCDRNFVNVQKQMM